MKIALEAEAGKVILSAECATVEEARQIMDYFDKFIAEHFGETPVVGFVLPNPKAN